MNRKAFRPGALALMFAGFVAACGTSGSGRAGDAGADATNEAGDDGGDGSASGDDGGGNVTDGSISVGPDAPQLAPDGCAYLNVTCMTDAGCCSGQCTMGICTLTSHP